MKFKNLETRLREGTLSETDLEASGCTPSDFMKMRSEGHSWANGAGKPEPSGKRSFRYVFVTESAIGSFRDLPLANGWDLKAFRDRRSPILLQHEGLPIGRAGVVRKNQDFDGLKALVGHVEFAPAGLSEVADLTQEMVSAGLLNCGSVGFTIVKMREPTEEEFKKFKMGKYSAVFEKTSLNEFSVVAVGRDPKAGVIFSEEGESLFNELVLSREYSKDTVLEVRDAFLRVPENKTTITYDSVDEWLCAADDPGSVDEVVLSDTSDEISALRDEVLKLSERVIELESSEEEFEEATPLQSFAERILQRYETQETEND